MKKSILAAFIAVLLMFFVPSISPQARSINPILETNGSAKQLPYGNEGASPLHAVTPVIPFGSQNNEIGFVEGCECEDIGPEDFIVEDGIVTILDSVNKQLLVYNSEAQIGRIDMPYSGYPRLFAKYEGSFYIFDSALDLIYVIDPCSGLIIDKLPLPANVHSGHVWDMTSDDQGVYLWDGSYNLHDIIHGGVKKPINISSDNNCVSWTTPYSFKETVVSGITVCFLSYDLSGNAYFLAYEEVPDTPVILDEVTLRRYSVNGVMTGVVRVPEEENIYHPGSEAYVDDSGRVYLLLCRKEGVAVYEAELSESYVSHMDSLVQMAKEIEGSLPHEPSRYSQPVSKTRTQVRSTVFEMSTFSWIFLAGNKHVRSNTQPPLYIAQSNVGDVMNAIPYAWGLWDTKSQFLTKQASYASDGYRYMTGNILQNTDAEHTTGDDCSGMASVAYGLGYKYSTTGFEEDTSYVTINKSNLQKMDFLVKSNVHIILFDSLSADTSKYIIYDAAKTTEGCVAHITVSKSSYSTYIARSPWS